MVLCATCGHYHAGSEPYVCTLLSCDCNPEDFVPQNDDIILKDVQNFNYYQSIIVRLDTIKEKISYMLEHIPGMRNTDDWEFQNHYWHYNIGFCTGMPYTVEVFNKIHNECTPESIKRIRQSICQPEHQAIVILQREIVENEIDEHNPRFWSIQSEITQIIKEATYIPTDRKLLKSKGIKEVAFKEALMSYAT